MNTASLHLMKKTLLFWGIMTLANLAKGQEIVTEFSHSNGQYLSGVNLNLAETTDKCLIVESWMFPEYSYSVSPIGKMFYKFSADGILRDSLLFEYDSIYDYYSAAELFERDPEHLDHFVYADFLIIDDTLFFRMRTIDTYLNYISDTIFEIYHSTELFPFYSYDLFAEPNGDIIASYSIKDDPNETFMTYFLRIGFDGTLKSRTEVPQIRYFDMLMEKHTGMFNESPGQYCYWGSNHTSDTHDSPPFRLYVLDSLFNVVEEKCFYFYQGSHWYTHNWNDQFLPVDDQHYLIVNMYRRLDSQTYYTYSSIILEKRNRQHVRQASAFFGESINYPEAIRAVAVDGNTIYLSYMTDVVAPNHLVLLRLDGDLNVQWERHFLSEDSFHHGLCMRVLDDGSIAVSSFQPLVNSNNRISVVVIRDNYDQLEELGIHVRPYDFYPNPVQDQLHLHYSPDVQPVRIDLYDLQGRLMHTQIQNFECLNLNGLAAGQYLMKVTMKDGKAFTDKVVKE